MNRNDVEAQIVTRGLTAPRVRPEDLDAEIASAHYFTALQGARMEGLDYLDKLGQVTRPMPLEPVLGLLTFCVLVLKNGFMVSGESACASPENFDENLGRKIAYENAKEKLWPLLGFRLKDSLSRAPEGVPAPADVLVPSSAFLHVELGQQVHFFEQINNTVTEAMHAYVTGFSGPGLVNLSVFAPNGTHHARVNVRLLDQKEEPPADVMNFARLKP